MRAVLLALAALLVAATPVLAHPGVPNKGNAWYKWGEQNSPTFSAAMKNVPEPAFEEGPCTEAARRSMPAGKDHDHEDISQHRFACNLRQTAFNSLVEQVSDRPDIVMGEMDVKGDLAVVAVAYPESGFLLFDVKDSANPKFLSWYRGDHCEDKFNDVDCGAFVDLSPDGKRVYISVQQITVVAEGGIGDLGAMPTAYPGIDVVDISDPENPQIAQKIAVQSVGGVHTTRSFEVPGQGEFTVSVANSVGAVIHKVVEGKLVPLTTIPMNELHDTFIQQDPLTKKTLMYIAGGFDSGFYIFDVSDPASPVGLGEWDITPECANDWYSHTLDVTTVNGRRIVTLPVELIDFFGNQGAEDDPLTPNDDNDQAQGCGKLAGNGDFAGPMFIVDATDFSKLGAIETVDEEDAEESSDMKKKSEAALITVWSNAAKRAGGRLVFSPHNQQIVGDFIYLSGYHSGVTVLDASEAFKGRNVRPKEVGVVVPTGSPTRPIHPDAGGELYDQFFTSFIKYRPTIWDMQWHKGHVVAADMVGGFYAFKLTDDVKSSGGGGGSGGGAGAAPGALRGSSPAPVGTGRRSVRCASTRRLRITLRDPRGRERVRSVRVFVDGKRVRSLRGRKLARIKRGARYRVPVTLKGRKAGRYRVRIIARTTRGRTIKLRRAYRTCVQRKRG